MSTFILSSTGFYSRSEYFTFVKQSDSGVPENMFQLCFCRNIVPVVFVFLENKQSDIYCKNTKKLKLSKTLSQKEPYLSEKRETANNIEYYIYFPFKLFSILRSFIQGNSSQFPFLVTFAYCQKKLSSKRWSNQSIVSSSSGQKLSHPVFYSIPLTN